MKQALKWFGMILGGLVGLILLTALGLYAKTRIQFNKTYDVRVETVIIPTDSDISQAKWKFTTLSSAWVSHFMPSIGGKC